MARKKQTTPLKRTPSDFTQGAPDSPGISDAASDGGMTKAANGHADASVVAEITNAIEEKAGLTQLIICVGGIYASFLSWALLQERITTKTYGDASERWTYSVVLNTIQSTFAGFTGLLYLYFSTPSGKSIPAIFPSRSIFGPLLLVAVTSSLASPFGYASLAHIDYVTFILAKSCKLLPVMFLHLTIFRKRYPIYKYLVVGLVTVGVAVFTLHNPSKKASKASSNSTLGLFLLGINLLFDGLTNSTQDYIFANFRPYLGQQMMVSQNILSTLLTVVYLLVQPLLPLPALSFLSISPSSTNELSSAMAFFGRHPTVLKDVLGFAACGAVGQIFIYATLARFSSLLLVTVTVTRKMLTMMLSVLWFGHRLGGIQWLGVSLVFGGVGAEGWIAKQEKAKQAKAKQEAKKDL